MGAGRRVVASDPIFIEISVLRHIHRISQTSAAITGSTSVACWLERLVKGSELNCTSGTVAGGSDAKGSFELLLEFELEPQLDTKRMAALTPKTRVRRPNVKAASPGLYIREKTLDKV